MMTPAERKAGKFLRAPDHPLSGDDTGGSPAATENNGGGNAGDSGATETGEDNPSQKDELEGFWNKPDDQGASDDSSDDETKAASQALGQQLGGLIQNFKGPEAFTKEIADAIADGDLAKANESFAARDQAVLKQSAVLAAQLVGGMLDRFSAEIDKKIETAFGSKDSEATLEQNFPLAKDPAMRPMVQRVWEQALTNSKGDKQKAIRLTRGMLNAFGEKTSIREPAEDPTAGINTSASKSLVADLLSRT